MKRVLVGVGCALVAAVALADTVRRGERLPGATPTAPGSVPVFSITLPGTVSALAAHADGRAALVVRQELLLVDEAGKTRVRRPLPGAGKALAFGDGESVAVELATGSAVLRYRDLFTRSWDRAESSAVAPLALPTGGFAFARGSEVVLTDGEAHELRRLHLPAEYQLLALHVLPDGLYAFASRKEVDTALVYLAWGERVTVRAVVRGKASDLRLAAGGAELAMEDGSLVHVGAQDGAIQRTTLPDDGYAVTAWLGDRSVAVVHGELVVIRRPGLRASKPFGAPVARTDAGLIVPRILVAGGAHEPFWILGPDGTLYRNDADLDVNVAAATRCEGAATLLAAAAGRALVACQNRLIATAGAPSADAGFSW